MKKYILIAGVNGAGKSTLYQTLDSLKDIKRVNIDEIVRENGNWRNPADVMTAGKQAIRVIKDYFDKGISFNQETTLCGNSILKNIDTALNEGYVVELHYVGVDSVDIAKQRIAYRVEHGGIGHDEEPDFLQGSAPAGGQADSGSHEQRNHHPGEGHLPGSNYQRV